MENNRKAILIVDDEETLTWSMSKNLSMSKKYKVICASSAEEALKILKQTRINLIVSDIWLGGKTGFDLLGEVKTNHPEIGFIVMTAYGSPESRREALNKGALHYIEKPFMMDRIIRLITESLEEKGNLSAMATSPLPAAPPLEPAPPIFSAVDQVMRELKVRLKANQVIKPALEDYLHQAKIISQLGLCTLDGEIVYKTGVDNIIEAGKNLAQILDAMGSTCRQMDLAKLQSMVVIARNRQLALLLLQNLPLFVYGLTESDVSLRKLYFLMDQWADKIKPLLSEK